MSLTARDIAEITRLLEESSFDELQLEIDGLKIHLVRSGVKAGAGAGFPGLLAQTPAQKFVAMDAHANNPGNPAPAPSSPSHLEVKAPLLGTFYRAPKPGAAPFVEVGANVEADSIIGIIEVMKLMNTVRAGARGVVSEIRARDGALVEYGETLLLIDPRESR